VLAQGREALSVLFDIACVVEVLLKDDVHEAERQREVGARVNGVMPVSQAGSPGLHRIDDIEAGALPARFDDEWPQVNIGSEDVGSPG
jgi:hypothetical protein